MSYRNIKIIFLSYLILIFIGAILLFAPFSHIGEINFLDALFTSTSATCVTGLIVKSTPTDFTFIGEFIILSLIQIGGIGYMSIVTLIFIIMKKELNLENKQIIKESLSYPDISEITHFLKRVFKIVFTLEILGSIVLSIRFSSDYSIENAIWYGIFHSVSAFNNAGFSLFDDSIMSYKDDLTTIFTLCTLSISGGIGYFVIIELHHIYKRRNYKLSIHSKLVLIVYSAILFFGILLFLSLEWNNLNTFGTFNIYEKFLNAFFLSVNFRSAGFNSIDIGSLTDGSLFFSTIFMLIGGSNGGTAGGIKVVTFTILVIAVYNTVKSSTQNTHIFKKSIPIQTINKALTIVFTSLFYIMVSTIFLTETQKFEFLRLFFEVVSAFGTVGVSTGNGGSLSLSALFNNFGKYVIIVLMLAGKVGILAFWFFLIGKSKVKFNRYPEGRFLI